MKRNRPGKCWQCLFNALVKEKGRPPYVMCAITGKIINDYGRKLCAVEPKHFKPTIK